VSPAKIAEHGVEAEMAPTEEQRANLQDRIARFAATVEGLPDGQFLHEVGGRTPRDIVAHLIGWNYHAIEASDFIRRGELPPSLLDTGPDFSAVNGVSMARFASRDKAELLGQLRASAVAHDAMIAALPEAEWGDNHGVALGDWAVTSGSFVGIMIGEYEHHQQEIADWPVP